MNEDGASPKARITPKPISRSSINRKNSKLNTIELELKDSNPNRTKNDKSNSSSKIKKWNMTIQ